MSNRNIWLLIKNCKTYQRQGKNIDGRDKVIIRIRPGYHTDIELPERECKVTMIKMLRTLMEKVDNV